MTTRAGTWVWKVPSALPGFGLSLGLTLAYLSIFVLVPLSALAIRPWENGFDGLINTLGDPRAQAALRLSFTAAAVAAVVNTIMGILLAWVLTRYRFPGRALADAIIDLPFALPTAVAGIALTALYAQTGPIGGLLAPLNIKIAYTPVGIVIAMIFVGLPFVVRSIQPVLQDLDQEVEAAARTLGATPFQTARRVILPGLLPALLSGLGLAFARGVGEYGSVIFIAGNMPLKSEIAPLLIVTQLEQFNYAGAATLGMAMLLLSFAILLTFNGLQVLLARRGQ